MEMQHEVTIEFLAMLTGSMALVYYVYTGIRTGFMKRETIDFLAYQFTSVIEDKVADGEIKREDATEAYRRLKQLFPTRELYPSAGWLKSSIQKRRQNGHHDPVELPGIGDVEKPRILPAFQKRK
jgi:hypothetical protein